MDDHPMRMAVMERARVAVERAAAGVPLDVEAIADTVAPEPDPTALTRLDELLPGDGPLAERIAAYRSSVRIPPAALAEAAARILELLTGRAAEDLDLPDEALPPLAAGVGRLGGEPVAVVAGSRVVVDDARTWTPDALVAEIARHAVPGRWLAARLRGDALVEPSPATTVDRGREAIGREVLLADHELAHELERVGRRLGRQWDGERMLRVRRALDDRAAAVAAVALDASERDPRPRLLALGFDDPKVGHLVAAWAEPMARADALASAAGPPLVRAWLATQGQTAGLRRLLLEPLVPTELRADLGVADA